MVWQLAALAGAQMLSAGMQAKQEKKQAKAESENILRAGQEKQRQSIGQAKVIRNQGEVSRSGAQSDLASRGFDMTTGTAGLVMDEYAKRIEYDAHQALLEGTLAMQNAQYEAKSVKKLGASRAKNTQIAGVINAGSTLYGGSKTGDK